MFPCVYRFNTPVSLNDLTNDYWEARQVFMIMYSYISIIKINLFKKQKNFTHKL